MNLKINLLNKISQNLIAKADMNSYNISNINSERSVDKNQINGTTTTNKKLSGMIICGKSVCGNELEPSYEKCL